MSSNLIGNRDEYFNRDTGPAHFWEKTPDLLAGIIQLYLPNFGGMDVQRGGTWLGITKEGRFSCLTNFRVPMDKVRADAKSRGDILLNYLVGKDASDPYLRKIAQSAADYNDFNLLVGDFIKDEIYYYGTQYHTSDPLKLQPGKVHLSSTPSNIKIYGMSNATLDTPWPKMENGKRGFSQVCSNSTTEDELIEGLFNVLSDPLRYFLFVIYY